MVNLVMQTLVEPSPQHVLLIENVAKRMMSKLGFDDFSVSIVLCDEAFIQELNHKYRDKNEPTDILSFPMFCNLKPGQRPVPTEHEPKDLGDLIIYLERVSQDAKDLEVSLEVQLKRLLAHGISHLLGYTHYTEEEHKLMEPMEQELIGFCQDL